MDLGIVEDSRDPLLPQGSFILPTHEIHSTWCHPELKRLRAERTSRMHSQDQRFETAEASHQIAVDRVKRWSSHVEGKRQALEAIERKRQQLAAEIADEEKKLQKFCNLEVMFGDQLIFHKSSVQHTCEVTNWSSGKSWFGTGSSSPCATNCEWLEVPSTFWNAVGRRSQLSQHSLALIKCFLETYAPTAQLSPEGRVTGFAHFDDPCILDSQSVHCRSLACKYVHLYSSVARLVSLLTSILDKLSSRSELTPHSSNLCCVAAFITFSKREIVRCRESNDEVAMEEFVVEFLNSVIERGWHGALVPESQRLVEIVWTVPLVRFRKKSVLDRVFNKRLGHFTSQEERIALEHVSHQCSADSNVGNITKNVLQLFRETSQGVLLRFVARILREHGNTIGARWLLETGVKMFPVDPHFRMELSDCLFAVGEDPVTIIKFVSNSLDVLSHQASALVLSRQRQGMITLLNKTIGFLLVSTAVRVAPLCRDGAVALLTCAVEAPGRYSITPFALQNCALLLAMIRAGESLDELQNYLPLHSVSDVCFSFSVKAGAFLRESGSAALKKQLFLCDQLQDAGISFKTVELLRSALRSSIFNIFCDDEQVCADTISHLEVEPRTFHADSWSRFLSVLRKAEGSDSLTVFLDNVTISPLAPVLLHLRVASVLSEFHCSAALRTRLTAFVNAQCHSIKLDSNAINAALVSDSHAHARLKVNGANWIFLVVMKAFLLDDAHEALVLLRAIPQELVRIQQDANLLLFYEKLAYCLHDTFGDVADKVQLRLSHASENYADGVVNSNIIERMVHVDTFRDILREEFLFLEEMNTSWMSWLDFHTESAVTVAHFVGLQVYRELPRMCPPEVQWQIPVLRKALLEVASECDTLHPWLQTD